MFRRILFHNFYVVYRLDRWFKRRYTTLGMFLMGLGLLAGAFGINTRATISYQLFALALCVLVVATVSGIRFRPRLELSRSLPRYGTVGEPLRYTVRIENRGAQAEHGLGLIENLIRGTPDRSEMVHTLEAEDLHRNWFDRHVGYPRWASLMRTRQGAKIQPVELPVLPRGQPVVTQMQLEPLRRGRVKLVDFTVLRPDPLGVFNGCARIGEPQSVLVLPRRYPVDWQAVFGRIRDRPGGVSQTASTGGVDEFATLREYRPGDPLRHIDWKGWARLGVPIVKEFHETCFVRHGLILDTFLRPEIPVARFEEAVSVAASFVDTARVGDGVLELLFVGPEVYRASAGQGVGTTDRMLEALACVTPCNQHSFDTLRAAIFERAGDLSACVCVFLAWDEQRRALVRALRHIGVPLLVLVVSDESPAPGDSEPMGDQPERFRRLVPGRVSEGLAELMQASATEAVTG